MYGRTPVGKLKVTVIRAQNLKDTQVFGIQDPYFVIELGEKHFNSKVCNDGGKNPCWNQTFEFEYENEDFLKITIKNKNVLTMDDILGTSEINLSKVINYGRDDIETNIITSEKKAKGTLIVALMFESYNRPQMPFPGSMAPAPVVHQQQPYHSYQQPPPNPLVPNVMPKMHANTSTTTQSGYIPQGTQARYHQQNPYMQSQPQNVQYQSTLPQFGLHSTEPHQPYPYQYPNIQQTSQHYFPPPPQPHLNVHVQKGHQQHVVHPPAGYPIQGQSPKKHKYGGMGTGAALGAAAAGAGTIYVAHKIGKKPFGKGGFGKGRFGKGWGKGFGKGGFGKGRFGKGWGK